MATTVWKGYLAFGLVSIPVRFFRAARAERVPLRQLYRSTPRDIEPEPEQTPEMAEEQSLRQVQVTPIQRPAMAVATPESEPLPIAPVKRVYERAGTTEPSAPIRSSELVKGYEYEKGRYVVVEEQELRALAPKTTTEMEIVEFVRFEEIDPVYLETSYYVVPEENGEKAYALLFEAMRESGYAAVGQLAMHRRDHVVVLRTGKTGLLAHTMFYPEEVRGQEFRADTNELAPKEITLAKSLIQALAKPFEPAKFKNAFEERLRELIASRASGAQPIAPSEQARPGNVIDIMDALRQSLAQVQSKSDSAAEASMKKPPRSERQARKQPRNSGSKARGARG